MHEAKPALIYQPGVSADAWPPIGGGISVCTSPRAPLRRNTKPVDRDAVTGGVLTFALPGSDSNNFEVFWTACRTVSFDIGVNPEIGRPILSSTGRLVLFNFIVECPLLAQSGHSTTEFQCPLLGVKQTSSPTAVVMSALCQKQTLCSAATDRDLSQHVRSNFRQ